MAEPLSLSAVPRITSARLVRRHVATWPHIAALRDIVRPLAARRSAERVSPAIHAEATRLLAEARRVLSREPFPRDLLILREAPDWATLLTRLQLAMTGLETFHRRYCGYDRELGEVVWHDEHWLSFRHRQDESDLAPNSLEES